ncbi:exopolysaccharide biosynthesis protein [Terricaulis sp.]|uniref:exopolysaccharide biosynthesis protein n=1 Tax=Terricaulis sp. TaxID=2768686 RepID=UPI002AC7B774|nr:exopolysaccharide biosynthesis protein [Terricaulis sp.]MDZ4690598.1 exopolysaccharide biosynthesis protein [Terricaulis sp.]
MIPSPASPPEAGRSASELLDDLVEQFPGEKVSVGALIDQLDSRAHGVLLLVLALPMCIPNVPGISTIFGVLMLAPALQMVFGSRRLVLPKRVREWEVDATALRRTLQMATPTLKRLEYLIKPRLSVLTRFPLTIGVGLQTLLMALILILPIPFANWPPGMTVAMTALALLQRDGILMLITIPAAAASVASVYLGTRVGIAVINNLIEWGQSLLAGFS